MKTLLLLVGLLGFAPSGAGAAQHQSLSLVLNADNASTKRLPQYRASAPIAVHVTGDASKFDAVTVTATGPGGIAIRAPLARTVDGFDGALRLVTPGAWRVAFTTQLGSVTNAMASIPLDVEPARGSELAGYATMLLGAMMFAAGVFSIVRRDLVGSALATVRPARRRS